MLLHAEKVAYRVVEALSDEYHPPSRVCVLTGSDIYPQLSSKSMTALARINRIVALHPLASETLPASLRSKVTTIIQSAEPLPHTTSPEINQNFYDFLAVSCGHAREIKRPLDLATASRHLPSDSRIRVVNVGGVLEHAYHDGYESEARENPRFRWIGEVEPRTAHAWLQAADLVVVSSEFEGGGRVYGEAVVAGTPILASDIPAARALLGQDYAGLFPVGDITQLAEMLYQAETSPAFLEKLRSQIDSVKPLFDSRVEGLRWGALVRQFSAAG